MQIEKVRLRFNNRDWNFQLQRIFELQEGDELTGVTSTIIQYGAIKKAETDETVEAYPIPLEIETRLDILRANKKKLVKKWVYGKLIDDPKEVYGLA